MKTTTPAMMRKEARRNAGARGKGKMRSALSILLAAVLFLSVCGPSAAATANRKPGDVDGDGNITAADARLALRKAVGLETYKENSPAFSACDVNFDGRVTADDARLILRASVGLEDPSAWKSKE